ncbi:MAG: Rrf2 family transcriptional regulator [candidate division Zixibacteria bacterium]|nr:Rrf2 family transcriptional regulator [candidate division Zixibacteria bacterium]
MNGCDMLLNRRSEYAILGLIALARKSANGESSGYWDVGEIAADASVPPNLLRVLFYRLAKDGLLRSQRGVRGGFVLGRSPERITVKDIVESVQGPISPFSCVSTDDDPDDCDRYDSCELYGVLRRVRNRVVEELERNSLADLVAVKQQESTSSKRGTFAA